MSLELYFTPKRYYFKMDMQWFLSSFRVQPLKTPWWSKIMGFSCPKRDEKHPRAFPHESSLPRIYTLYKFSNVLYLKYGWTKMALRARNVLGAFAERRATGLKQLRKWGFEWAEKQSVYQSWDAYKRNKEDRFEMRWSSAGWITFFMYCFLNIINWILLTFN